MRKLKLENVNLAVNTSIKVHVYNQADQCYGIGWHLHPEYELVYIRNGKGMLNIDTQSIPYTAGTLLLLGKDIPHTDFGNSDHRDALEVVVQFSEAFVQEKIGLFPELARVRQLIDRSRQVLLFRDEAKQRLDGVFSAMSHQNAAERLLSFLTIMEKLSDPSLSVPLFAPASLPTVMKPANAKRLERVFALVNQRYAESLSSSIVATELGMTTNSFCRFFKANTQKTFTRFLNDFRLTRARDLLESTDLSVQEVMYATGFRDGPYFSRLFKRATGRKAGEVRSGFPSTG